MIELQKADIQSGPFQLSSISFQIPQGCYAVLLGQTGAGKTTLLEAICGLRRVRAGKVLLDGTDVTSFPPGARGIGYVPQDVCLFPRQTVRQHLEFALRLRRWTAERRQSRVTELAELLRIGHLLDREPRGLSGGEAQRVALGRALSFAPRILLLDEPLSALDPAVRQSIAELLGEIHRATAATVLHVTHRLEEVSPLAQQILRLIEGRIVIDQTSVIQN